MRSAALALALLALPVAQVSPAQTANVSPTSPGGASPGAAIRTPPSGSTARPNPGQPQVGAPTATEQHYDRKAQKDTTSVCKGC